MEKEFVPYQESLDMKLIGFDEPCFGLYYRASIKEEPEFLLEFRSSQYYVTKGYVDGILAPTFSQAFRWFIEKHGLAWEQQFDDGNISLYVGEIAYPDNNLEFFKLIEVDYDKYGEALKEAELECLKKLIERIKNEP